MALLRLGNLMALPARDNACEIASVLGSTIN
jgi:hypothetical protein